MKAATITIRQIVSAPVEKVWDFWTNPDHITKWNAASEDWHTTKASNDLQIGGRFLARMEAKDGSMGFDFSGKYTEVIPFKRIEYKMDDKRKVNVTFEKAEDGVYIIEEFEAETDNSIEQQRQGWQAILDNFKKYSEANIKL